MYKINLNDIPKFVINLERDKHKITRFRKPMKKQKIDYSIWRGSIINCDNDLKKYHNIYPFTRGTKKIVNKGNIGSGFAHLSLWNYCKTLNDNYFLIFEDNSVVNNEFLSHLKDILNKIKDFDYINLNALRPTGNSQDGIIFKHNYLDKIDRPFPNVWMSSYLISKKFINNILNDFDSIDVNYEPIDWILVKIINNLLKNKKINCYSILTNHLTTHKESSSDTRKLLNMKVIDTSLKSYISTKPLKVLLGSGRRSKKSKIIKNRKSRKK